MLLLRRVAVLELLPRQELDQWHHRLSHVNDAPLLLINVGSVHNDSLQAVKRQRLWKELAKQRSKRMDQMTKDIVPFSIRSIRRWGVPTAIPVRLFLRKETCSSTLKCLANCRTILISYWSFFFPSHRRDHGHGNLPTWQPSCSLFQTSSKICHSSGQRNSKSQKLMGKNSTPNRNETYLTKSAARKPAPATTKVCGDPFFLGASANLAGFSENSSRNSGRLSLFLGFWKEVVSLIAFAVLHHQSHVNSPGLPYTFPCSRLA